MLRNKIFNNQGLNQLQKYSLITLNICQTRFNCDSSGLNPDKKKSNDISLKESQKVIVSETKMIKKGTALSNVKFNQEQESVVPNHDPQRITAEGRKLEIKARSMFDKIASERGTDKAAFLYAVNTYISQDALYRRGAVEFIYSAMYEMKRFGVIRDLTAYKALLQVFPEGKMIPRNVWQVEFMHYPRQQQCGIDMLEQMEVNGVIPDDELGVLLKNRFGTAAHVTRKYRRMLYWLPKFKNINPYPVPFVMPTDPVEIALLILKRMCVDKQTKYTVLKTSDLDKSTDEDTFIVSAQSPVQQELISKHDCNLPLFVEGPHPVYLRYVQSHYFLLRADPNLPALVKKKQQEMLNEKEENLFEWTSFFEEDYKAIKPSLSIHEQEDSTILALCITGTCSKSSAQTWIRWLQELNSNLVKTPVLFKHLQLPEMEVIGDSRAFKEHKMP